MSGLDRAICIGLCAAGNLRPHLAGKGLRCLEPFSGLRGLPLPADIHQVLWKLGFCCHGVSLLRVDQSTCRPALFTRPSNRLISSRSWASKSAGVLLTTGCKPATAIFSVNSSVATTLFTAAESLFTMDSGVPLGIARAYQESRRKFFRPYSPKVGTSGSSGERSGAATASARTWPALIWGNTEPSVANDMGT